MILLIYLSLLVLRTLVRHGKIQSKILFIMEHNNMFTDTKAFKNLLKNLTDRFHDSLYAVWLQLTEYNVKIVKSDINIKNFNTQSVANRANGMRVKVVGKINNKMVEVYNPIGFIPSRLGKGYNFDSSVNHEKTVVNQIWSNAKNRAFKNPSLESLSWVGYFTCQLMTGQLISSESVFKLDALNTMLAVLKPVKLDVSLYPQLKNDSLTYDYNLPMLRSLIACNKNRVELIHNLDIRKNTRGSKKASDKIITV